MDLKLNVNGESLLEFFGVSPERAEEIAAVQEEATNGITLTSSNEVFFKSLKKITDFCDTPEEVAGAMLIQSLIMRDRVRLLSEMEGDIHGQEDHIF